MLPVFSLYATENYTTVNAIDSMMISQLNGKHDHSIRHTFYCVIAECQISFPGKVTPLGKTAPVITGLFGNCCIFSHLTIGLMGFLAKARMLFQITPLGV